MQRQYGLIVHSWDFDGMLAAEVYVDKLKELIIRARDQNRKLTMDDYRELARAIIATNKDFFNHEMQEHPHARHVIYVGSDRQNTTTDMQNGYKGRSEIHATLSCYPFFVALIDELNSLYKNSDIQLDKLLLEDIYKDLPPGTTFDKAMQAHLSMDSDIIRELANQLEKFDGNINTYMRMCDSLKEQGIRIKDDPHLPQYSDKSKFLIMLAQIQHALNLYGKNNEMCYQFSDDRSDILRSADKDLRANAIIIPSSVTVTLQHNIPTDNPDARNNPGHECYQPFETTSFSGCNTESPRLETSLLDIRDTHNTSNQQLSQPAAILLTTIKSRREAIIHGNNQIAALVHIQTCLQGLVKSKLLKKNDALLKLVKEGAQAIDQNTRLDALGAIQNEAAARLNQPQKRKGSMLFRPHLTPQALTEFYELLSKIDTNNPDPTIIRTFKDALISQLTVAPKNN